MTMISLRDYHREIESLIESNQNDEAIFHCMVILQTYPKCIETYRNLGKSLLENKRFSEASEVFSKILTVFPDDFIAHVGLSVIREEERDLDAAIWHMEQAFELQPSNLAIQEELRRLFGRRDGVPPVKIRLTRGALVKMYARGELHQQAIAEIKNVLKDEPSRLDYKVLLAKMYYVSGAHTEAVEVASEVIENHPYCFEANKVLDELLGNSSNKESGNIYRERLISLDPYYQFVDALSTNTADIPSEKITIEKKLYVATSDDEIKVSDWTKQIGLNWKERENIVSSEPFDLLDQVNSFENKASEPVLDKTVSPFIGDFSPDLNKTDSDSHDEPEPLPEWIVNAGWTRATEVSDMENQNIDDSESNENDGSEARPSQDLPDWLKSLAPAEETQKPDTSESGNSVSFSEDQGDSDVVSSESASEDLPDWLKTLGNDDVSSQNEPAYDEENKPPIIDENVTENVEAPLSSDDLKQSIENWSHEDLPPLGSLQENEISEEESAKESPSEWLNKLVDENLNNTTENTEESLPDWLKNFESEAENSPKENEEPPDWLSTLSSQESDIEQVSIETGSLDTIEQSEPDSVQQIDDFLEGLKTEQPLEDTDDFLRNLSDSIESSTKDDFTAAPEELVESKPAVDSEQKKDVPSWVKNILSSTPVPAAASESVDSLSPESTIPTSSAIKPKEEDEIEPLISDLPDQNEHSGAISGESNDELISWLRDVNPEDGDLEKTIPIISDTDSEKLTPSYSEEISLENLLSDELPDDSVTEDDMGIEPPQVEMSTSSLENRLSDLLQQPLDENISQEEMEERQDLSELNLIVDENESTQDESLLSDILEESKSMTEKIPPVMEEELMAVPLLDKIIALLESGEHSSLPSLIEESIQSGLPVDEIIESFEAISQKQSESYEFWQELGDLYLSKSDLDNALKAYNTAAGILQI